MFSREKLIFLPLLLLQISIPSKCLDFGTVYMESDCGNSVSMLTSFQLESSTGLTYKNQLDCAYTVTAPSGQFVVAIITRFELEPALTGTCTDYVDFHDGSDTSATKLNSNLLCGSGSSIPSNVTSSGESMTLRFVTDNFGVYLGFSINFVAATNSPCSTSQFECNTTICIDSSLQCDSYNQCGDSSDEDNCSVSSSGDSVDVIMIVIIVLVVVTVIAVIVAIVAYKIHERNRWKKFINMHINDDDGIVAPPPSYPVTHLYYKGAKGHPIAFDSTKGKNESSSKTETETSVAGSSKDIKA